MSALQRLILLLTTLLVWAATAQPIQDDAATGSASSGKSVISSGQDGLTSLTSEDVDQAVVIRQRRGFANDLDRKRYCKTRGCHNERRNPWNRWRPSYLEDPQDRNKYRNRNNRHRGAAYVPNGSDSDTLYVPKPIMYIANPKPASHPKKSKGAIMKIE